VGDSVFRVNIRDQVLLVAPTDGLNLQLEADCPDCLTVAHFPVRFVALAAAGSAAAMGAHSVRRQLPGRICL
jgi:hypothetical protein